MGGDDISRLECNPSFGGLRWRFNRVMFTRMVTLTEIESLAFNPGHPAEAGQPGVVFRSADCGLRVRVFIEPIQVRLEPYRNPKKRKFAKLFSRVTPPLTHPLW